MYQLKFPIDVHITLRESDDNVVLLKQLIDAKSNLTAQTPHVAAWPEQGEEGGRECQGRHFCIFVETLPLTRDRPPAGTPISRTTLDILSALAPVLATGWTPQWRPTVRGTTWSRRAWTGGTPHSLVFCRMGR